MNSKSTWPILLSLTISLSATCKLAVDISVAQQAEKANTAVAKQALSDTTSTKAEIVSANFNQVAGNRLPQGDTAGGESTVAIVTDTEEDKPASAGLTIHTALTTAAADATEPDIYDFDKSQDDSAKTVIHSQKDLAAKPSDTLSVGPSTKPDAQMFAKQAAAVAAVATKVPAEATALAQPAEKISAEIAALTQPHKKMPAELATLTQLPTKPAVRKSLATKATEVDAAAKIAAIEKSYQEKLAKIQKDAAEQIAAIHQVNAGKLKAPVQLVKEVAKADMQAPTEKPKRTANKGFDGLWPMDSKDHQVVASNITTVDSSAATDVANGDEFSSVPKLSSSMTPISLHDNHQDNLDPVVSLLVQEIETSGGKNTNRIATKVSNIADKYVAVGQPAKAEMVYQQALAAYQRVGGLNNLAAASLVNNLATFYFVQNRYFEAGHMYRLSLETFEKLYPLDHQYVSVALHNLVTTLAKERRNSEAEACCKRIIAERENKLGRDNLAVAGGEYELATLYLTEHKYPDAESLLQHALTIRWRLLGNSHPDVIATTNAYQKLLHETNRSDEADALNVRALAGRQTQIN